MNKRYDDLTDEYIINWVTKGRKRTLKSDLRRHKWALIKKYFGFHVTYLSKEDMREWIGRLTKIINEPNMNKKLLLVISVDIVLLLTDIFLITKMVTS